MKSKIIKGESHQPISSILSGNKGVNYITQHADKKEYKPSKAQNESNRINSNFYKSYNENAYESSFLKNLDDNLFEYLANQNSKDKSFSNKNEMYPMLEEKEKFLSLENIDNNQSILHNNHNNNYNNFAINQYEESIRNIYKENLNEERLSKIFKESSNEKNNKNLNETKYKEFSNENGTGLLNIQNQNNKKNSTPDYNYANYNQNQITNNKKTKAKQTINSTNYINQTFDNNISNVGSSKDYKLNLNDSNKNFNNLKKNSEELIDSNYLNSIGMNEDLIKKDDCQNLNLNLALNEDDKSIFMKTYKSQNPFEDYSFGQNSNIFNWTKPIEGIMHKLPNETKEKMNFNFDLSRNASLDYNDIFKSVTNQEKFEENNKLARENNLFYDVSFFSISSIDKKCKAVSDPGCKGKKF
jgi:hypothetical protein